MPVSAAQKRATTNYRLRLKGTEKGEILLDKCRGYARKSFNKLYHENPDFRTAHLKQCNSRAYYLNDDDQFLRSIRKLFI
jgi:hypothetical protein